MRALCQKASTGALAAYVFSTLTPFTRHFLGQAWLRLMHKHGGLRFCLLMQSSLWCTLELYPPLLVPTQLLYLIKACNMVRFSGAVSLLTLFSTLHADHVLNEQKYHKKMNSDQSGARSLNFSCSPSANTMASHWPAFVQCEHLPWFPLLIQLYIKSSGAAGDNCFCKEYSWGSTTWFFSNYTLGSSHTPLCCVDNMFN